MRNTQYEFDAAIELRGNQVYYTIDGKTLAFPIDHIQLIGEYSVEPGTFATTYFFSFKIRSRPEIIDIPAYADGIFEMLAQLKNRLQGLGSPKLQMSTEFDSNILFPADFRDFPLYEFRTEAKPLVNLPFIRDVIQVETIGKQLNPALGF